jgi:putative SOS response-associated peptidase YedK
MLYHAPMCGRFYRVDLSWEDFSSAFDLWVPEGVDPPEGSYNIAPSQYAPIIRYAPEGEDAPHGALQMAPALWGLVPSWWKKPLSEKKFSTFNARAETAPEMASYRGAFRHHRCLVPASGFYEWTGEKGAKQPFAISLRNRKWFCFAGLWDRAMIDGSEVDSFTILTVPANDMMRDLHSRMPVILSPGDYGAWLDLENRRARELLKPLDSEEMQSWPVSKAVGNVRSQGADLIAEIEAGNG